MYKLKSIKKLRKQCLREGVDLIEGYPHDGFTMRKAGWALYVAKAGPGRLTPARLAGCTQYTFCSGMRTPAIVCSVMEIYGGEAGHSYREAIERWLFEKGSL